MPIRKEARALGSQILGVGTSQSIWAHWGATSLTPKEIFSGIVAWWAMDRGFSATGGRMVSVDEQVGGLAGNQLVQDTAANQPYVVASDANFGGRQVINADGAAAGHNLWLKTSSNLTLASSQPFTVIVTGRIENSTGTAWGVILGQPADVYDISREGGDEAYLGWDAGDSDMGAAFGTKAFAMRAVANGASSSAHLRWSDGTSYQSGPLDWPTTDWLGMEVLDVLIVYGWPGAVADVIMIAGTPSVAEWDSFVTNWLVGYMGWTSISILAVANNETTANTASFTATLPSGIQAGDLLIVCVGHDVADSSSGYIDSYPAGWRVLVCAIADNGITRADCLFRYADGTEGASIAFSCIYSESFVAKAWRITGHNPDVAPEITVTRADSGDNDPGALAPSWGAADTLWLEWIEINRDSTVTGYPSGFEHIGTATSTESTPTDRTGHGWCDLITNTASEDPGTWTNTNETSISYSIAIPPATVTSPGIKIKVDGSTNVTSAASSSTTSVTQGAGTNRRMFVCIGTEISSEGGTTISSVTYGSVALTAVTDGSVSTSGVYATAGADVVYAWYSLLEASLPADGAHDLVVTLSASEEFSYGWWIVDGCSQTSNVENAVVATSNSSLSTFSATIVPAGAGHTVFAMYYNNNNLNYFQNTEALIGTVAGGNAPRFWIYEQASNGAEFQAVCKNSGLAAGSQSITFKMSDSSSRHVITAFSVAPA